MDVTTQRRGREGESSDPSVIWFAEECLNNGVRLESYVQTAEGRGDRQLAEFFRRAAAEASRVQPGDRRRGRLRHVARVAEFGCV